MGKKSKTVSFDLNSKKGAEMANEEVKQNGGAAADQTNQQADASQQSQDSGNVSEVTGSVLATSASIQQDTTQSSGAASSTDSSLDQAINQADAGKESSNEDAANGNGGAGAPDQSADTGNAAGGDGQAAAQGAGEAQASPTPAVAPVTAAPVEPAPVSQQTAPVALNPVSDLLNQKLMQREPSFAAKMILSNLEDYMHGMKAGKPVDVKTQVRHQRNLHALLTQTINDLEDEDFTVVFTTICQAFEQDPTGCFADTHIYRAWGSLNLTGKQRLAAEYIVKLVMTLGPTKGRDIAKQHINVESALKYGINERGRHRIIDYFKIA